MCACQCLCGRRTSRGGDAEQTPPDGASIAHSGFGPPAGLCAQATPRRSKSAALLCAEVNEQAATRNESDSENRGQRDIVMLDALDLDGPHIDGLLVGGVGRIRRRRARQLRPASGALRQFSSLAPHNESRQWRRETCMVLRNTTVRSAFWVVFALTPIYVMITKVSHLVGLRKSVCQWQRGRSFSDCGPSARAHSCVAIRLRDYVPVRVRLRLRVLWPLLSRAPRLLGFTLDLLRGAFHLGIGIARPLAHLAFRSSCRVVHCALT